MFEKLFIRMSIDFKTNHSNFWDFAPSLGRSKPGIILRTLQNISCSFTIHCLIEIWMSSDINSWVQGKNVSICFWTSTSVALYRTQSPSLSFAQTIWWKLKIKWWTLYFVWLHVTSWPLCEIFHDFLDLMCLLND